MANESDWVDEGSPQAAATAVATMPASESDWVDETAPSPIKPKEAAGTGVFPQQNLEQDTLKNFLPRMGTDIQAMAEGALGPQTIGISEAIARRMGVPTTAPSSPRMLAPYMYSTGEVLGTLSPLGLAAATEKATLPIVGKFLPRWLNRAAIEGGPLGAAIGAMGGIAEAIKNRQAGDISGITGDIIKGAGMGLLAGTGFTALGNKAIAGLSKTKAAPDPVLDAAKEMGITLSPADVTGSKAHGLMETLFNMNPITAGIIQKFKKSQLDALTVEANDLKNSLATVTSGDLETVGTQIQSKINFIQNKIQNKIDEAISQSKSTAAQKELMLGAALDKYRSPESYPTLGTKAQTAVDKWAEVKNDAGRTAWVNVFENDAGGNHVLQPVQIAAQKFLDQMPKEPEFQDAHLIPMLKALAGSGNPDLERAMATIPAEITGVERSQLIQGLETQYPPGRSLQDILKIRSDLNQGIFAGNAALRTGMQGMKGKTSFEGKVYSELKAALDEGLKGISDNAGGNLKPAMEEALALTREKHQFLDSDSIKAFRNSAAPEDAVLSFVNPNNSTELALLKAKVGERGFKPVADAFANKILGGSGQERLSPEKILSNLNSYGKETVEEAMGKGSFDRLIGLSKQLQASLIDPKKPIPIENLFFRQLITKSLENNPQKVVDTLIRPFNTKNAALTTLHLGDDMRKNVVTAWMQKRLEENQSGVILPSQIAKLTKDYGEETLKAWMGADVYKEFQNLSNVSSRLSTAERIAGNVSGTGGVMEARGVVNGTMSNLGKLAISIIGAGGGVATGGAVGGLAGLVSVLVLPRIAAKIYTSKAGLRWATEGLIRPEGVLFKSLTKDLAKNMVKAGIIQQAKPSQSEAPQFRPITVPSKLLSSKQAAEYLSRANGDPDLARKMATEEGYKY